MFQLLLAVIVLLVVLVEMAGLSGTVITSSYCVKTDALFRFTINQFLSLLGTLAVINLEYLNYMNTTYFSLMRKFQDGA